LAGGKSESTVLEAAITGNGGRVVKTIGDVLMAEFAVPSGANVPPRPAASSSQRSSAKPSPARSSSSPTVARST